MANPPFFTVADLTWVRHPETSVLAGERTTLNLAKQGTYRAILTAELKPDSIESDLARGLREVLRVEGWCFRSRGFLHGGLFNEILETLAAPGEPPLTNENANVRGSRQSMLLLQNDE